MDLSIIVIILISASFCKNPFSCGQILTEKKPYGLVERQVDCEYTNMDGLISVLEFKKGTDIQHGTGIHYDTLWRKRDSCFYLNGEKNGTCLIWDTLGNEVGRATYRHGKNVGKREVYFSSNHPALIKNYNTSGQEEGPWFEWWKNGNKKVELIAKNGEIISGSEYYQDGKPRIQYRDKYDPKNRNVLKTKTIEGEAWAPNGKSTGRIEKGNGEWLKFPDGKDPENKSVFHEIYKDGLMIKVERLDSAQIAQWLKP